MNKKDYIASLDYVDTRSVWPVYIKGLVAVELTGKPLSISIEDAREVAYKIQNAIG